MGARDGSVSGEGSLKLLARDAAGKDVGRSVVEVDEKATGKNLLFEFDKLTQLALATQYELAGT